MARMHENAPLLSAFEPYFSQMRIRTCLAKARCSSRLGPSAGFHAGGGSPVLSSVIVRPSASPSALTPVNRYPSLRTKTIPGSREHPLEPEPALRIGGRRDRLGAVAAVEHVRAGDRLAVGADDPAGEVAVGVDQHDLAEVVRLAGLAGHLRMPRPCCVPWPRPRRCNCPPARGHGRRTSRSRRWCTSPARCRLPSSAGLPFSDGYQRRPPERDLGAGDPLAAAVGHQAAEPDGVLRVDRERDLALDLAGPDHDGPVRRRIAGAGPERPPCRRGRADRGGTSRRGPVRIGSSRRDAPAVGG